MEKQKKSYGKTALIILLLIVTIASLVLATYAWAKYSSVTEGTATAEVAKWDVDVTFDANTFEERYQHVLDGKLAPGMSGSFEITVDPGETEVDFNYEIIFEGAEAEYLNPSDKETLSQKTATVPKHLHFYTSDSKEEHDASHEIDVNEQTQTGEAEAYLKGELDKQGSPETKTIYWEWPFEDPNKGDVITDTLKFNDEKTQLTNGKNGIDDYDDQDTLDGMYPVKVTVNFKVVATQQDTGSRTDKP